MATVMKKQSASLDYPEHVRQHLSRLPSIDPNERALILCGYPNVGKSSFINKITRADVEVLPFEFTTKSLFLGHTYHKGLRWQVIDTPGLLDHPLEDRNTIEMQTITALAHLRAVMVFIVDISGHCGHNIAQQIALFNSIRPLFVNKPIVFALNKIDIRSFEALAPEDKDLINKTAFEVKATVRSMSIFSEATLSDVMATACDLLLDFSLEQRIKAEIKVIHPDLQSTRDPIALCYAEEILQRALDLSTFGPLEKTLISESHAAGDLVLHGALEVALFNSDLRELIHTIGLWIKTRLLHQNPPSDLNHLSCQQEMSELAKKGLSPSQIGVVLRDSHGVDSLPKVTVAKLLRILKAKGLAPSIPEDLYRLIRKAVVIRKHLETNCKDSEAKFHLILIESRIHRLSRYYKHSNVLPSNWKYSPATLIPGALFPGRH